MKTFILKYGVNNSIYFPMGTIVSLVSNDKFIVVEGILTGKEGCVAVGLHGWLITDNEENRKALKQFQTNEKKLLKSLDLLTKNWNNYETAKL